MGDDLDDCFDGLSEFVGDNSNAEHEDANESSDEEGG
jgi:hypothetical protein